MADEPPYGVSRYQSGPDDTPTVPNLFAQGNPPPGFWDAPGHQPGGAPAPGAQQGRTGPPPAGSDGHSGDGQFGVQVASTLPPRSDRRRGALIAVGLVALATVVVVAAALLIGPHLGGGQADGDQQAAPPVSPASTGAPSPTGGAASSRAPVAPPMSATSPGAAGSTGAADPAPSVVTVTVTPSPSTTGSGNSTGQTARSTASSTRSPSKASTSTAPHTTEPSSKYGVPIKQIACSNGYIVQLASELTPQRFAHRVAVLKSHGLVPADAKAADSAKSCKLFTNQTNTFILYAGPFPHPYDACADRLRGPYDAFIRGADPGSAADFVSCICPATVAGLPTISKVGSTAQWIGELQHMLAAHLRYSIPDLKVGSWGVYTPDTRAAVKRFQSDSKLRATGTVDAKTWKALQHAGC